MKIGIITVQKAPNYGAVLQCYALWKYFVLQGVTTEVIDLYRKEHNGYIESSIYKAYPKNRPLLKTIKSIVLAFMPFLSNYKRKENAYKKKNKIKYDEWNNAFDRFNNRIHYSKPYYSIDELYRNPPEYDIYMTGSDQLWNPTQSYSIEPYFLTFVRNGGKKISYATSIGQENLSDNVFNDYKSWIKEYDFISLREQSAIDLLQPFSEKNIERTIDPTLLIDSSEWHEIAIKPKDIDYVFCYTLHPNMDLLNYAVKFSESKGMKLIYWVHGFKDDLDLGNNVIGRFVISPEEWIGYIKHASYVITDSFHGSVFSIIFHKEFYTFIPQNNTRGSRIRDLFSMLNLENRLLDDLCIIGETSEPNYREVDEIIQKERTKSISFLENVLNIV